MKNKCSHTQFQGFPEIKPEKKLFTKNEGNKNIHSLCFLLNVDKAVDNVDNPVNNFIAMVYFCHLSTEIIVNLFMVTLF